MYNEFAGNVFLELKEIERFEQREDSINVEGTTVGNGGFLTLICCD